MPGKDGKKTWEIDMISGQLKFRSPEKACYDLRLWDKIEYHKYLDGEYMLVLNFDHPFALQTADVRGGPFRPQPVLRCSARDSKRSFSNTCCNVGVHQQKGWDMINRLI